MEERTAGFAQAVRVLPEAIQSRLLSLPAREVERAEEVRLRAGQPPSLTLPEGERVISDLSAVTGKDLEQTLQIASRWSLHTVLDQLCKGFLTVEGGHRIGVCGTTVMGGDGIQSIKDVTSVNLRIARQHRKAAAGLSGQLCRDGELQNTLILAPPGLGKTTLLRDLIRRVSGGEHGRALRVAVVDERGELAAVYQGRPQMDLGPHTDILDGCPKAQGIMLLLRGMNPQVIAVDEITAAEDVSAMEQTVGCGVTLLATAHASGPQDLERRPLYRSMMEKGIFRNLVVLRKEQGERRVCVQSMEKPSC